MSNPKRVKSKRTGRAGYRFRFTDPATGARTHRTFWLPERREAERAFTDYVASREAVRLGLPDNSGWQISYGKLVSRFLDESPISSDDRRRLLARVLERNELRLTVVSELASPGPLTSKCRKLAQDRGDVYVRDTLQQMLKQMTAWAAGEGIISFDPLASWRRIPRKSEKKKRLAFLPEQVRGILEAAVERDEIHGRQYPTPIVIEAMLLTGNRPGAVLAAKVRDFDPEVGRINLPEGNGNKKNGAATLPPAFVQKLVNYLALRGTPGAGEPLFMSPTGSRPDGVNVSHEFRSCMILAFVKMSWPAGHALAEEVEPIEVATLIEKGRVRGFDGAPPRDPEKILRRREHVQAVEEVAALVAPNVERLMHRRDFYALKKTHISWARQSVNRESVMAQVGHIPQDTEEKYYLDLVDPSQSSQAVWDVLTGRRQLRGVERRRAQLRLAVGAETSVNTGQVRPAKATEVDPKVDLICQSCGDHSFAGERRSPKVIDSGADRTGASSGIRTQDLCITNALLCH